MSGNVEEIFPLAPLQGGLLFHSVYDPEDEATPYVAQHVDELTGPLDVDLLVQAWQCVVDRHGALRTCFVWEDVSEPVQVVLRQVEASFTVLDWRDSAPEDLEPKLARWARRDRRRGFDLGRPPLHRLSLICAADDRYFLVTTFHHLLLDGWSVATVTAEFFQFYRALRHNVAADLGPAAPYGAYMTWLSERSPEAARAHWRDHLRGYARAPLPGGTTAGGDIGDGEPVAVVEAVLGEQETQRLVTFCRDHRLTVNTIVQAALGLVLAQWTGQDDVVFGGIVSTRPAEIADVESIVGMLINTLPVRVRIDHQARVADWLRTLQQEQIECRQYDYVSLGDIQTWSELPSGHRLFDALLTFQNYPSTDSGQGEADLPTVHRHDSTERSDFPLSVTAHIDECLRAFFTFDRQVLSDETVQRGARMMTELLQAMVAAPGAEVGTLPTMGEREREIVLGTWSGAAAPKGSAVRDTVHGLFETQADRTPQGTAVVLDAETMTYRELDAEANRLAHHLIAKGAGRSSIIGICVDRHPALISSLLAALKTGGAYMLLDPTHPDQRLQAVLRDARPTVVVTTSAHTDRLGLRGALADVARVRLDAPDEAADIAARPAHRPGMTTSPEDLACVMFTSGSSGRPKAVAAPHRALTVTHTGSSYLTHGPDRSYLQCSPVPWDAFALEVFSALFHGGVCVLQHGQSPDLVLVEDLVAAHSISALQLASSLFNVLVDEDSPALGTVDTVMVGAEAASPKHVRRFLHEHPESRLVNGYGPVETLGFTTVHAITVQDAHGAIPIGRPIEGKQVYVLDHRLRPVPPGVIGELYATGDGLAHGYLHQCDLTAERFVPCPFGRPGARMYRTGDRARWREDGILTFHGRADDQVKIRGFRVEPKEIEAALAGAPAVGRAVVVGREDTPGRKQLVGYVTAAEDASADDSRLRPENLQAYLRQRLPDYMVPAAFAVVPEFPLNSNGKVDRAALPAPRPDRAAPAADHVSPRTPAERRLAEVWADVLHRDRIGVHDNFFTLGGDSLGSIRLVSRLRKHGVTITPRTLFENPTIADLAAATCSTRAACDPRADSSTTGRPAERALRVALVGLNASTAAANVFCLPYGGGGLTSYLRLAELLADDARVIGLEDNATDHALHNVETSLTALAAKFLEVIRTEQPHGPYHLVGWSLGGVLAHEVARQARDAGAQVGPVCVIDSVVPVRSWRTEAERDLATSSRALAQLRDASPMAPASHALRRDLATLNIGTEHLDLGHEHLERVLRRSMLESSWLLDYHPDRADHDMILYQAAASTWPPAYADDWRSLVRSLDHRIVPGDHRAPLLEPNVTGIADAITSVLQRHAWEARSGRDQRVRAGA
ncbi:non-ribosomal peptide synthetase [Micromonospora siamensis]|uniref:Amino acid adenylation domain-containing protein n=1 Tax=Micromonospora siamensis TaxID=299152 RepID=A0A1C5J7M6_9ACTN|nr:non-ribosomal peptide synthetase [Micromonospora siamensis]SCG66604.1 amino acid adenylation domain-containing protein [Micromonospora siamensis]